MQRLAWVLLLLTGTALPACQAKIVIFGDSLSDQGLDGLVSATELVNNRFSTGPVNTGVYPPSPYYQGRFSNGFVWADVAAKLLGQENDNYATGGSNGYTGEISVLPPYAYLTAPTRVPVRSLVQQAEAYAALNADSTASGTDTVIIFTGIDEYYQKLQLKTGTPTPDDIISAVNESLSIAFTAGARNFVVVTLPELTLFPFGSSNENANELGPLTTTHNDQLQSAASAFNSSNPDASVVIYNVSSVFSEILATPNGFGPTAFTNTTGPCRGSLDVDTSQASGFSLPNCPNGDAYVFWDSVHPSKHTHQAIGQDFYNKLNYKVSAQAPIKSS